MATIVELEGVAPAIGEDVFLAPTAVLVGDVRIGDRASIWFGAVLRADTSHIEIGEESAVQDNAVVHCAEELPTIVGPRVTVGHSALLEGCIIEEAALIGMGAIILQRAHVGSGAMVAAGAVVLEGAEVRPQVLVAGVPAREKKELSGSALAWTNGAAEEYQQFRQRHMKTSRVIEDAQVDLR